MKSKIFTLLLFTMFMHLTASAVMLKQVTSTSVRFYNFSNGNYNLAGHYITVGLLYFLVDNLTHQHRSSLVVAPGTYIDFEGLTIPNTGSIGLWDGTASFPNPGSGAMVDFVQYGAAGQPFEAQAVQAYRWVTGQFVSVAPPFEKTTNVYSNVGSVYWATASTGCPIMPQTLSAQ